MNEAIQNMLKKYHCHSRQDYTNALKEIFQEIALLGLWRSKFYEKAAFYGGSALRILYGLDRFSEDLDFTLLAPDADFSLASYNQAIMDELNSFGFDVQVITKIKNIQSTIQCAFIKASSKKQLLVVEAPTDMIKSLHRMQQIKIKMEVDIDPPGKFTTEAKQLSQPISFSVKTLTQPDLFAGKIHAILCRPWKQRVKGRDWYDFVWYIGRGVPVNLIHLRERLIQSKAWSADQALTHQDMVTLLHKKIQAIDFSQARRDVVPF